MMQALAVNCDILWRTGIGDKNSALNAELDFIFGEQIQCIESTRPCTGTVLEQYENNVESLGCVKSI